LIDSVAMEDQVAFSPDGRSIAFVSTASGNADIYVLPFAPERAQELATATNVTNHPGGDFRPDFSPDGARIAFTTDRDTPVSGHPIFAVTRQREGDVYVMNRDGTRPARGSCSRTSMAVTSASCSLCRTSAS
jgi:Tol biopolymer transport system component